jgi:CubicO group peptidase (beta-lactamase class C family)
MTASDPIAAMLGRYVDADEIAGAATLVWKDGKVVQTCATGWRDRESLELLERDAIFRIASMTKPVTSVAALMLVDEGRIALADPISRWAPEFADMRVLRSPTGPLDETDPAAREITFDDLLTHRSGLTYGSFHAGPIQPAYEAALGGDIDSHVAPDDWITALAALPLIDQPGAGFHYGNSTDLLGFLIARIEGEPLGAVLQRRIFGPLGMTDTGFTVPADKAHRKAQLYGFDAAGGMIPRPTGASGAGAVLPERPADMTYVSGSGGLWSTLDDYLAFARLFLGDGAVDGVRLLQPETLAGHDDQPADGRSARPRRDAGHADLHRPRLRLRPGRRHGPGHRRRDPLQGRRRHSRLAGRLRRLVAGRSDVGNGDDLPGPQRHGAGADGHGHRPRRLRRHHRVPRPGQRALGHSALSSRKPRSGYPGPRLSPGRVWVPDRPFGRPG